MTDLSQGGDAPIKALIASAVMDLQRLIKAQVALAKLELQQSGRAAGKASIFIVGALSLAGTGGLFLLVTLAYVIAIWLPVWAGFGIVTLVLFLIAVVLGIFGKNAAGQIKGPERTVAEIEKTKSALQGAVDGHEPPALPER